MTKFTVKSHPQGQVWVSPLDRPCNESFLRHLHGSRAVLLCMDQISWGPLNLQSQNSVKSQIRKLRWLLLSFTHPERSFPFIAHSTIEMRFLLVSQIFSDVVYSSVVLFYNGPNPPPGFFDAFLRIPNQEQSILTRSYGDFVKIQTSHVLTPVGFR